MLHDTKLFVRRLAYMPWLLAVGLVLGWTGEAAAQVLNALNSAVTEQTGGSTLDFTVTLNPPNTDDEVTVDYRVTGGTAVAGVDFTAVSGTLTFPANQAVMQVPVQIADDALNEDAETLTLTLSNPQNATINPTDDANGGATGEGTIHDNDPLPSVSVEAASATEGSSVAFTLTLSAESGRTVTVSYTADAGDGDTATAGTDFTAVAATAVTFAPGQTEQTVLVTTVERGPRG